MNNQTSEPTRKPPQPITKSFWKTTAKNTRYALSITWELAKFLTIIITIFGMAFATVYGMNVCLTKIKENIERDNQRIKRINAESAETLQMKYAGLKFYKFNLENHRYWVIQDQNSVSITHSESCPCKTNRVEVIP